MMTFTVWVATDGRTSAFVVQAQNEGVAKVRAMVAARQRWKSATAVQVIGITGR